MSILPPYSRREDAQMQSSLKFSGLRNNLEEIITGFFQKRPKNPIIKKFSCKRQQTMLKYSGTSKNE